MLRVIVEELLKEMLGRILEESFWEFLKYVMLRRTNWRISGEKLEGLLGDFLREIDRWIAGESIKFHEGILRET